jgi:tetratricopeptide (TPR) repeat protein
MQTTEMIGQKPEFQDAVVQRAMSLYGQGQFNSADLLFATVGEEVRLKPLVRHMRGLIARHLGFKDEARTLLRQAIEADPTVAAAHANLGILLLEDGHFAEALAAFAAALALNRQAPAAHFGMAQALGGLGFTALAIEADRDAIALQPDFSMAENHLCRLLTDVGRGGEACDRLRMALTRHPDDADLHGALAVCLLTIGDWSAAWAELERRWDDPRQGADPQLAGFPRWRGEDLAGRTILLQAERSDADTLQFCRYAPLVQALGGKVVLRCRPSLVPLLATLSGIDQVVAADQPLPTFAVTAPLLSVPAIFRTQPDGVPADIPYLHADARRVAVWRDRLGASSGLKVGVSWAGDIALLRPLLDCPAVRFVSLDGTGGDSRLSVPEIDRTDGSLEDTAALIAALDLIIATDGPLAHLAGALGKLTWILLPAAGDWRWLRDRADTPWYPRTRLFRQRVTGRWDDVIERVGSVLRAAAAGEEPPPVSSAGLQFPAAAGRVVADALFAEGTRHHQAGDLKRAGSFYQTALAVAPDHADALCNLGALEQGRGARVRARQALERAIALAPRLAPAHRVLGDLLRSLGVFAEAAEHYRQALDAAPLDGFAHAGLAMTLRGQEDYEGAMVHFQRAVEIDRGQPAVFFLDLGQTLLALGRLESAEVSLLHAVALDGDLLLAHCVLGRLYLKAGRRAESAASFRRALAIDAQCALARNGLADLGAAPTSDEETA